MPTDVRLFPVAPTTLESEFEQINLLAHREYWWICDTEGEHEHPPFEIQHLDDHKARWPKGDEQVWWYVWCYANRGFELHQRALRFIRTYSPQEWEMLLEYVKDRRTDEQVARTIALIDQLPALEAE